MLQPWKTASLVLLEAWRKVNKKTSTEGTGEPEKGEGKKSGD